MGLFDQLFGDLGIDYASYDSEGNPLGRGPAKAESSDVDTDDVEGVAQHRARDAVKLAKDLTDAQTPKSKQQSRQRGGRSGGEFTWGFNNEALSSPGGAMQGLQTVFGDGKYIPWGATRTVMAAERPRMGGGRGNVGRQGGGIRTSVPQGPLDEARTRESRKKDTLLDLWALDEKRKRDKQDLLWKLSQISNLTRNFAGDPFSETETEENIFNSAGAPLIVPTTRTRQNNSDMFNFLLSALG